MALERIAGSGLMEWRTLFKLAFWCPACGEKAEEQTWVDDVLLAADALAEETIVRHMIESLQSVPVRWPSDAFCRRCWRHIVSAVESQDTASLLRLTATAQKLYWTEVLPEVSDGAQQGA